MANRVAKFVDCRTRDTGRREIYIVEGDSALGSCKLGRDAEFQAIIPVRGKILNCLKADYDKIFKNDIITDLIKVLGCGVEVQEQGNKELQTFDLGSLRWNKIIICTDADVDGFQIRTLILTMLYRLVPTLIDKGFVYIAESPLFEITDRDMTYFAYTEKEKTEITEKLKGHRLHPAALQGPRRKRPGYDVADDHEPRDAQADPVSPEDAAHGRGIRPAARRQSQRAQGIYRRERRVVSRACGRIVIMRGKKRARSIL
jgi:DNA gyrase subunit B